ncbi:MAG: ParB/Srx family N-terminal domain-containing protein [Gemmatimonadales bacterium]|nr:ParB/Srx family N-terminal domain-containing protein [Gemmatimonadales bacterium]
MASTTGVPIDVHCSHDKLVDTGKLRPNPINPNTHPPEQVAKLARLLLHHGWRHPITVSKRSGLVVAGHCRLLAALELKCDKVPVDYQEFDSEAQEWAVLASDNIVAELAITDGGKMADGLVMLDQAGIDSPLPELTALDLAEIEAFIDGPTGLPQGNDGSGTQIPDSSFGVMVECGDEAEQKRAFELLKKKGFSCRSV